MTLITPQHTKSTSMATHHQRLHNILYSENNEIEPHSLIYSTGELNSVLKCITHACAHELKEPLRSAASFLHLLSKKNTFDHETLDYIHHTQTNINRLNLLIKDISYYMSITEETEYEQVRIDMNDVFKNIKYKFKSIIHEKGVNFLVLPLPIISGIRIQIFRIFYNLIDNALKFSSQKRVRIKIYPVEQKKFWKIHVRDNGIGIENEYHEAIFDMFTRLNGKDSYEGSGMGLAICKKLIERNHGKIEVKSVLDGGSEFIVTLPK